MTRRPPHHCESTSTGSPWSSLGLRYAARPLHKYKAWLVQIERDAALRRADDAEKAALEVRRLVYASSPVQVPLTAADSHMSSGCRRIPNCESLSCSGSCSGD